MTGSGSTRYAQIAEPARRTRKAAVFQHVASDLEVEHVLLHEEPPVLSLSVSLDPSVAAILRRGNATSTSLCPWGRAQIDRQLGGIRRRRARPVESPARDHLRPKSDRRNAKVVRDLTARAVEARMSARSIRAARRRPASTRNRVQAGGCGRIGRSRHPADSASPQPTPETGTSAQPPEYLRAGTLHWACREDDDYQGSQNAATYHGPRMVHSGCRIGFRLSFPRFRLCPGLGRSRWYTPAAAPRTTAATRNATIGSSLKVGHVDQEDLAHHESEEGQSGPSDARGAERESTISTATALRFCRALIVPSDRAMTTVRPGQRPAPVLPSPRTRRGRSR